MFTRLAFLAGSALLFFAVTARAQVVSLVAARDNTIFQNVPANSDGGAFTMFAGNEATPSPRRALLAFNVVGSIPAGSVITSVQLTLTLQGVAGGDTTPRSISARGVGLPPTSPSIVRSNRIAPITLPLPIQGALMMRERIWWMRPNISSSVDQAPSSIP